jgi:DNA mismatch repair protein MutL
MSLEPASFGSEPPFSADAELPEAVAGDGLYFSRLRFLGQLGRSYLLLEAPEGLILIDQHAAHERILFDRLTASRGKGPGQMLLRSAVIDLFPREADTLRRWIGRLREAGFDIEPFGGGSFIVKSLPAALGGCSPESLIRDLLRSAHEEESSPQWDLLAGLASSAACHSAVKAGQRLRPEEIRSLLEALDRTPFGSTCPHGRPLWVRITLDEIGKLFGRT